MRGVGHEYHGNEVIMKRTGSSEETSDVEKRSGGRGHGSIGRENDPPGQMRGVGHEYHGNEVIMKRMGSSEETSDVEKRSGGRGHGSVGRENDPPGQLRGVGHHDKRERGHEAVGREGLEGYKYWAKRSDAEGKQIKLKNEAILYTGGMQFGTPAQDITLQFDTG
jgi:hypothetical protein